MITEHFIEDRGFFKNDSIQSSRKFDEDTELRILLIEQKSDRLYIRRLLEASLNLASGLLQDKVTQKNTGLSESHIYMLKNLGRFMGYYVGSTSFEMNELKDFDEFEFKSRLTKVLACLCKSKKRDL